MTDGLASGRMKYVVIDPRLGKTGSKAWKWMPNKPGTEAAIALALIQAINRDEKYNAGYLQNANKAASANAGEPNFCNASWLVKLDEDGKPSNLLRGSDLGLEPEERPTAADAEMTWKFDLFVVMREGETVAFDPNDEEAVVVGDLLVDAAVGEFKVKSGLQVLVDSANEHTIEEWAEIAGVNADDLRRGTLTTCSSCATRTAAADGPEPARCFSCRLGSGVVTASRDDAGLRADLLSRQQLTSE